MRLFRLPRKPQGASEAWSLEVQIHPSDIRRRVRYLFLTRRQLTLWSFPVLAYLAFLALGVWVARGVIGGMLNRHEYSSLVTERALQGERLQDLVGRLEQLEDRTDGLHVRMNKILLAYGLPSGPSAGQGGYPFRAVTATAPDSIYGGTIYGGTIQQGNRLQTRIGERLSVLDAFLREVRTYEQANGEQVRSTPSICPLRGGDFVLTSTFGRRRSPFTKEFELHAGLDLAAPQGMEIHAPADGVVVFAGQYPMARSIGWWRYGNLVMVRNGDRFVTLFGHCQEVRVRAGQKVRKGDVLGTVGNTGWSTSPHLHYEVRRRIGDGPWAPVDPLIYILDHRWPNEERLLARARSGPEAQGYEPLPPSIGK
ncbi:MAG TPA: M23 family metallopeptidase [Thermoanaerobaculia bacterium]|nr:M23 family metallopeptidase [Thermoanaerobaculia bacterium]